MPQGNDNSTSVSHTLVTSKGSDIDTIETALSDVFQGAKKAFGLNCYDDEENSTVHYDDDSEQDVEDAIQGKIDKETCASEEDSTTDIKQSTTIHEDEPINEFEDNDRAIAGSFPDVFLFGTVFVKKRLANF